MSGDYNVEKLELLDRFLWYKCKFKGKFERWMYLTYCDPDPQLSRSLSLFFIHRVYHKEGN